jgi:hypothetical protein
MKRTARSFVLAATLLLVAAILLLTRIPVISARHNKAASAPTTALISTTSRVSHARQDHSASGAERASPLEWLIGISESKDSIYEKLARIEAGLPSYRITALWHSLLHESPWLQSGQLPGCEKWESEIIFNALLDSLGDAGEPRPPHASAPPEIITQFSQLISTPSYDIVLRDYAIQRALMLAADALRADGPERQALIGTTLALLTMENRDASFTGTALNTFLSYQQQWSAQEQTQIKNRIEQYLMCQQDKLMPPAARTATSAPRDPDLATVIPLLSAIGGWQIRSGLPYLEHAMLHRPASLQIPAIAAWSQFPSGHQEASTLRPQVQAWATSNGPLRYAAASALRRSALTSPGTSSSAPQ